MSATPDGGNGGDGKRDRSADIGEGGVLAGIALRFTAWAERWFPDAFIFVAIAVVVVAAGALANGASVGAVTKAFGDGFWTLIPFTMQMAFVTIGGYVVATSPPVQRLIDRFALSRRPPRGAVGFIGAAEHARLPAQLGPQPDLRRASRPRHRPADRPAPRLPRRGGRGLSRARRHLGAGPELVRRPAAGQPREPAARAPADHRRDSASPRRSSSGSRW